MTRRSLLILYLGTLFTLVFGVQLLYSGFVGRGDNDTPIFSEFEITQLLYVAATLLLIRKIFQRFYVQRAWWQLICATLFVFPGFILFRYGLEEMLFPVLFGRSNYVDTITFRYYIGDNIGYALYYIIVGILLFAIDNNVIDQKRVLELEAGKSTAALQALQAQFNPHFLFNSLNNIYMLIQEDKEKAGTAILKLSALTRYLIDQRKETCTLAEELTQCNNYIELQSLRYDHPLPVRITLDGPYEQALIPPFTLVSFIENACKHGDFKNNDHPLTIDIHALDRNLDIRVTNAINRNHKDTTGGVGLQNIRQRLALIFPNQHTFSAYASEDIFIVVLSITYADTLLHT